MDSQWLVFGVITAIAVILGLVVVCTNLFREFWDDLDEDEIKELEKFRRNDEFN